MLIDPLASGTMSTEGHYTVPIRTDVAAGAQLAGLAGHTIAQLSRAGLEADAMLVCPAAALVIRRHHAYSREPLTVPLAGLAFGIAAEVNCEAALVAPINVRQVIDCLQVMGIRKGPQFMNVKDSNQLLQHRQVDPPFIMRQVTSNIPAEQAAGLESCMRDL